MKKKLYICGDSFCARDPEYGPGWVDIIESMHPELEIKNFSSIGASNYLIYLQVKQALEDRADYVIFHATSSIRHEFLVKDDKAQKDSVDRYWRQDRPHGSMRCNSFYNVQKNLDQVFNSDQRTIVQDFFSCFFDFPSQIEKNYIFISYILNLIATNQYLSNWAWSQGGFEHPSFASGVSLWDFETYRDRECQINLWDHYQPNVYRPHYHVTDASILQKVCEQYSILLSL